MHHTEDEPIIGSGGETPASEARDTRFARRPSDGAPERPFLVVLECLAGAGEGA